MTQTVICAKWGTRYPADYVNRLWSMIKRHTGRDTRLVCYTDDATDINQEIARYPIPEFGLPVRRILSTWRKLAFWSRELDGVAGDVLFIDLDVVITGSIDDFFDFKPGATFCAIENWTQRGQGIANTSVYRFRVGAHDYLRNNVRTDAKAVLGGAFRNEQTYVSRTITEMTYWPSGWCLSFKHNLVPMWPLNFILAPRLPASAKVICFTGKPDPHEARAGIWPAAGYKKLYKHVRAPRWLDDHWR